MTLAHSVLLCALNSTPTLVIVGPEEGFTSFSQAVAAVSSLNDPDGSVVLLKPGTHVLEAGVHAHASNLDGPLKIEAWDRFSEVIIQGNGSRCLATDNVDLIIRSVTMVGGTAGDGGAVRVNGGSLLMEGVTIRNCQAGDMGGAMLVSGTSSAYIEECAFAQCTAPNGGALSFRGTMPEITESTFSLCGTPESTRGGAIDATKGIVLSDVHFLSCMGGEGGTVHAAVSLSAENCTFRQGHGEYRGGAVSAEDGTSLGFFNCSFFENSTGNGTAEWPARGGAISAGRMGTLFVLECGFHGNESREGGAIDAQASTAVIRNSVLAGNHASDGGGAVQLRSPDEGDMAAASIIGCTFRANTAGDEESEAHGGALALYASDKGSGMAFTLMGSEIADNSATGAAGGLWASTDGAALEGTIFGALFSGNTALSWSSAAVDCTPGVAITMTMTDLCDHPKGFEVSEQVIDGGGNDAGNWCCPGDVDGSGSVESADLVDLLADWGKDGLIDDRSDVDRDSLVNIVDLMHLLQRWGSCD